MSQPVIVHSTCADETKARQIAQTLVEQRIAACVNIVPGVTSIYRWEDKINTDSEFLLIIKSQKDHVPSIRQVLQELSGYDVPEVIAMDIIDGSAHYLDWLIAETRQQTPENTSE